MNKKRNEGLTLIEIMIAVAIFAFVVGVTAVTLVSSHNNLQIQRERIQALHAGRAVIESIREKRKDFVESNGNFNWEGFYAWVNGKTSNDWLSMASVEGRPIPIPNLQINVVLRNMNGGPAGGTTNPVQVFVTTTWTSIRGHPIRNTIATILTSR